MYTYVWSRGMEKGIDDVMVSLAAPEGKLEENGYNFLNLLQNPSCFKLLTEWFCVTFLSSGLNIRGG